MKAAGTLNYVEWFGFNIANENEQEGYYLPLMFKAPSDATATCQITVGDKTFDQSALDAPATLDQTIQQDASDKYFSLFLFVSEATDARTALDETVTITVDWYAAAEETKTATKYPITYTLDLSGLTLAPKTNSAE